MGGDSPQVEFSNINSNHVVTGSRFAARGSTRVSPERTVLKPPSTDNSALRRVVGHSPNADWYCQSWQGFTTSHDALPVDGCTKGGFRALDAYLQGTYHISCSRAELPSTHRPARANRWGKISLLALHVDYARPMGKRPGELGTFIQASLL